MRGRVCNLPYNCFWTFPEQSLLGQSPAELTTIFYCLIWDSPNLEGQVPVFISSRNKVAQLYPQALGSLFAATYDLKDYGGGILTLLHTGSPVTQVKVKVILWPAVCRPAHLGVRHPPGTRDQFFPFSLRLFFLDSFGFVGRPLWRAVWSVLFIFCQASPAPSAEFLRSVPRVSWA
jgi:hypothetical protein